MMYVYRDEGAKGIVELISQKKDGKRKVFTLKMVKQLRPSRMFGDLPKVGEEFSVSCVEGSEAYVGWDLSPLNKEELERR